MRKVLALLWFRLLIHSLYKTGVGYVSLQKVTPCQGILDILHSVFMKHNHETQWLRDTCQAITGHNETPYTV